MSVISRVARLFTSVVYKLGSSKVGQRVQSSKAYEQSSRFVEDRVQRMQQTATQIGKDAWRDLEGKRLTFAEKLEHETDLQMRYRRIEEKLAKDLAELEMRKAVLESNMIGKDRVLFDESYEYARKEIINKHMQEASKIFHPNTSQKLRNELFASLARVLRGEKLSTSKENFDQSG